MPGRRFRRKSPRLSVRTVAMCCWEGIRRMSIVAMTGRRGQPCSEDGPPQTMPTVRPTIPESADRIKRETAGRKPAVVPVEAAGSPVEVGVPWPVAEAHPALRRIATSDIADARRRSVLVPRVHLPPAVRVLAVPCRAPWRQPYPYYGAPPASSHTLCRRRFRRRGVGTRKRACGDGRGVRGENDEGVGVADGARSAVR